MSKIVIEKIVCDEHDEEHDAPVYAVVQLVNRKTGKLLGTYGIDVCEAVVVWYSSNGTRIIKRQSTRSSRKSAPRKRVGSKNPTSGMIRAWAKSQGLSVSQRGRISKEVTTAYRKAH